MNPPRNRFPGRCSDCGGLVKRMHGFLDGKDAGGKQVLIHEGCAATKMIQRNLNKEKAPTQQSLFSEGE